jgi:hypothetical protein
VKVAVVPSADAVPVKVTPGSVVLPAQSYAPSICDPVWASVTSEPSPVSHRA